MAAAPPRLSIPRNNQSVDEPDGVRVSHLVQNGELLEYYFEDAKTLYECFQRGKRVSNNGNCLGWRPNPQAAYQWVSYGEVDERAVNFGAGLSSIGVEVGQKALIGIIAPNSVNWVIAEQSCSRYSRVLVPLYETLGKDAISYIINQAEIATVICAANKVSTVLDQVSACPTLHHVISMGESLEDEEVQKAESAGLKLHTMSQIEQQGKDNPVELKLASQDDLASICYTSGTTGNPKGVMITNKNLVSNVSGLYQHAEGGFQMSSDDVHMSYLPLAHQLERTTHVLYFMFGAKIGFFGGNIKELLSDIQALRPTIFVSVPRLLNRIYDRVVAQTEGSKFKQFLFRTAFNSKMKEVNRGIIRKNSFWDKILFKKVQNLLGGRVRLIMSGGAPLSTRVMDFLRVAFGCIVMEGYGQTECTAAVTATLINETVSGTVGPPIPCVRVKLVDVPDMNYYATKNEGEICFKGPVCTPGYFKDSEKTREAIDEDGWLHSGDIGCWMPNGTLKITDRKKQIFKLAQGEYIAPEKVENIYCQSKYVAQAFLFGDSLKSCCVAVVVPDEEVMTAWAAKNGKAGRSMAELCTDPDIEKMIMEDIKHLSQVNSLNSMEQAKAIKLHPDPFSAENGLLTPTFKLKRAELRTKFMEQFTEMYSSLN